MGQRRRSSFHMIARYSNKAESRIETYLNRICTLWWRAAWEGGSNEGLGEMEEPALIELTRPPFFFFIFFLYFLLFFFFFIILPGGPIAHSTILYYPEAKADQHQGWCLSGWTLVVVVLFCFFCLRVSFTFVAVAWNLFEKSVPRKMSCSRHFMGKIAKTSLEIFF